MPWTIIFRFETERKLKKEDKKAIEDVVEKLSKPGITEIKLHRVSGKVILGTLKKPIYDKQHKFLNPRASWMLIRKIKSVVPVASNKISVKKDTELPKELR